MATKKSMYEAPTPAADRKKALQTALSQLEKTYGKGTVMRLGDRPDMNVEAVPTGSLALDAALGIGGVPKGRIIEIYGPESSGKTTLALHILAECQKQGGEVAFVDAEHALDPIYAAALGVDTDNMLVSQPDTGEQALEITDALVRSGAVDAVVVDSVAALTPRAEIEGEMGDTFVGLQARLMSQALRKLAGTISKTNCVVIFINQLRMKIGVMYGNPETTTGGNALKFYSSVRLDVRRVESIKEGGNVIGSKTRVKVVKNKVAPPFREAIFDIMYGQGISKWGELVDLAVQMDIVQKSGSWFSMGDERIGQGKDSVKTFLMNNPDVAEEVEAKVRQSLLSQVAAAPKAPAKAAERPVAISADDFDDADRFHSPKPGQGRASPGQIFRWQHHAAVPANGGRFWPVYRPGTVGGADQIPAQCSRADVCQNAGCADCGCFQCVQIRFGAASGAQGRIQRPGQSGSAVDE